MPGASRQTGQTRAISLRLDQARLDALAEAVERTDRFRSELLLEAIDHWLLLNSHGLNAVRIVEALNHPDQELAEIEDAAAGALEMIQEVRARLIALALNEQPRVF